MNTAEKALVSDSWLDALTILREKEVLPGAGIGHLLQTTRFELMTKPSIYATFSIYKEGRILVGLNPRLLSFPRIERTEFFLTIALDARRYHIDLKWHEFRGLCSLIGCDYSNSINPRERWRWLEMQHGAEQYWYHSFLDDRPKCGYCDRPMPTGSDCHPVRRGVHETCGYELDALMEKIKELEAVNG